MKCCFDCVFCEWHTLYPFGDFCDVDGHELKDVYSENCEDFYDENKKAECSYSTLLKRKRAERKERSVKDNENR